MKIWENKNLKKEGIQCLLFFGIGVGLMIYSLYQHSCFNIDWVMSPYLFPLLISVFLLLLAFGLAAETMRDTKAETEQAEMGNRESPNSKGIYRRQFFLSVAGILVYYLTMPYLGFIFSSLLFLAAMFWLLGERRWQLILLLSAGITFVLYGIFHGLLHVMLP